MWRTIPPWTASIQPDSYAGCHRLPWDQPVRWGRPVRWPRRLRSLRRVLLVRWVLLARQGPWSPFVLEVLSILSAQPARLARQARRVREARHWDRQGRQARGDRLVRADHWREAERREGRPGRMAGHSLAGGNIGTRMTSVNELKA